MNTWAVETAVPPAWPKRDRCHVRHKGYLEKGHAMTTKCEVRRWGLLLRPHTLVTGGLGPRRSPVRAGLTKRTWCIGRPLPTPGRSGARWALVGIRPQERRRPPAGPPNGRRSGWWDGVRRAIPVNWRNWAPVATRHLTANVPASNAADDCVPKNAGDSIRTKPLVIVAWGRVLCS